MPFISIKMNKYMHVWEDVLLFRLFASFEVKYGKITLQGRPHQH